MVIGVLTAWTHSGTAEVFPWLANAAPRAMAGPTPRNAVMNADMTTVIGLRISLLFAIVFY